MSNSINLLFIRQLKWIVDCFVSSALNFHENRVQSGEIDDIDAGIDVNIDSVVHAPVLRMIIWKKTIEFYE